MNGTERNGSIITHRLWVFICPILFISTSFANPPQSSPQQLTSAPRTNISGYLSTSPTLAKHLKKEAYQKYLEKYALLYKLNPESAKYKKITADFKSAVEKCKPQIASDGNEYYPEADLEDVRKAEIWLLMKSRETDEKFTGTATDMLNLYVPIGQLSKSYDKYGRELKQFKETLRQVIEGLRYIEGSRYDIFGKNKKNRFPEKMCVWAGETVEMFYELERIFKNNEKVNLQLFARLLSEKEKEQKGKWEAVIAKNLGKKANEYTKTDFPKATFAVFYGNEKKVKIQKAAFPPVKANPVELGELRGKIQKDFSRATYKPLTPKPETESPNPATAFIANTKLGLGIMSALFWIGTSKLEDALGIGGNDEHHKVWQEENWKTIGGNLQIANNNWFFLKKVDYTEDVFNATSNNWNKMEGAPFWQNLSYLSANTAAILAMAAPVLVKAVLYYGAVGTAGEILPVVNNIVPVASNKIPVLTVMWNKIKEIPKIPKKTWDKLTNPYDELFFKELEIRLAARKAMYDAQTEAMIARRELSRKVIPEFPIDPKIAESFTISVDISNKL